MDIGAAGFGSLATLLGAKMTNDKNEYLAELANNQSRAQFEQNVALQKEFAQHGIRWRVEDAKEAGLHPLFALGAQGASYTPSSSPIHIPGDAMGAAVASAGQQLSRAVMAQETDAQREAVQLNLDIMRQRLATDFAQEQSIWSQMALREQAAMNSSPFPNDVVVGAYAPRGRIEEHALYQDAVQLKPDEMSSRNPSFPEQTAGRDHSAWREFTMGGRFKILLPATGQGGIPEEIDVAMLPFILAANRRRYGERWSGDALRYLVWAKSPDDYENRRGPSVTGKIRY